MERRTVGTVAAVLVFVFVLLAIWAGYYLFSELRTSGSPTSHTLAGFELDGRGNFTAALRPNDLCNCTQITGGNATLFPAITQTINVTLATRTSVSTPATIGTTDLFTVALSTAAWSKPIYATVNHTSLAASASTERVDEYSVNVSQVVAQISLIDGQLGYSATQAWLTLTSAVMSTITVQGVSETPGLTTIANFTFLPSTIGAGFTGGSVSGSVTATSTSDTSVPVAAYLYLALALAALAASTGWLAALRSRDTEEESIPPLDDLIAPFEEVIAETATPPSPATTIPVDRWKDLVTISDTLGKPILRPPAEASEPGRGRFYVLDGSVGYVYRYSSRPRGVSALAERVPPRRTITTTERLRRVTDRVREIEPTDPRFEVAMAQFRQVRNFLRSRQWIDADRAFDELEALLNRPDVGVAPGRGKRGSNLRRD